MWLLDLCQMSRSRSLVFFVCCASKRLFVISTTNLSHISLPNQPRLASHCQRNIFWRNEGLHFGGARKPLKHKSEKEFRQHCKSSLCCMQISERLLPRVSRFNLNESTAAWSQPAIPMIFGHFIISGCSHNSDLNG